jgi:hypothetical protein
MKTLQKFLSSRPSYFKCGVERLAKATGIATSTINKFRKTNEFKDMKKNYLSTNKPVASN